MCLLSERDELIPVVQKVSQLERNAGALMNDDPKTSTGHWVNLKLHLP